MDPDIENVVDLISKLGGSHLPPIDRIREIVTLEMQRAAFPQVGAANALTRFAPSAKNDNQIWWNGELIPHDDAKVHVLSPIVQYGRGVFEGQFCVRHKDQLLGFRFKDHFERLLLGAKTLGLECPYDVETLCKATCDLLKANNIFEKLSDPQMKFAYIRPSLVKVSDRLSGIETSSGPVVVSIVIDPWGDYVKEPELRVVSLQPAGVFNEEYAAIKACGKYNVSHDVKNKVKKSSEASGIQYNEGLLIEAGTGNWIELSAENVFVLLGNKELWTPSKHALKGITLDTMCQIAEVLGYKVVHRDISTEALRNDRSHGGVIGVYACGSAASIKPIVQIDDWKIDSNKAQAEFKRFKDFYTEVIHGEKPEFAQMITVI